MPLSSHIITARFVSLPSLIVAAFIFLIINISPVSAATPIAPTLSYPPSTWTTTIPSGSITFQWTYSGDTTNIWFYFYMLKWDFNQGKWVTVASEYAKTNTYDTQFLADGYYAWQVAAADIIQADPNNWYKWMNDWGKLQLLTVTVHTAVPPATITPNPSSDTTFPTIGTPSVTNITNQSAQVSFTATDTYPANETISCRVNWCNGSSSVPNCLPENYFAGTYGTYQSSGALFTANLSGLFAASTIRYDMQCKDAAGNITLSSIYTFNTSAAQPTPTPISTLTPTPTPTLAPTPTGPKFYVSLTGSDSNNGSFANPWKTIHKGVSMLTPGATLYIRGGTHQEAPFNGSNSIPNGTDWSHSVTIAAYPGEAVTFKPIGSGTNLYGAIWLYGAQYIIIDGLILDAANTGSDVIELKLNSNNTPTQHIRLQNCEIMHGRGGGGSGNGVWIGGIVSSDVKISNCRIHDNGSDISDHGIYISYGGDNNIVENSEVYNNTGSGIQIYGHFDVSSHGANQNIIRNNRIHNNGSHGLIISSGSNNLAYNNLIYANGSPSGSDGIYVSRETNGMVYNNTVYSNAGNGIDIYGAYGTTQGNIVKNNISYQNKASNISDTGTGTIFSNNLCSSSGSGCAVVGNPLFLNTSANDFHLLAGSPAINAGTTITSVPNDFDGVTRPQGSAYDIGAYEHL